MLTHEIALTEQELKILQEVQQQLGLLTLTKLGTMEFFTTSKERSLTVLNVKLHFHRVAVKR